MCTLLACSHVQTRPDMRERAEYVLAQVRMVVAFVDLSLPLAVQAGLVGENVRDYYVSVLRPQVALVFSALSTALEGGGGSEKASALEVAIEQAEQVLRLLREVLPPAVPA